MKLVKLNQMERTLAKLGYKIVGGEEDGGTVLAAQKRAPAKRKGKPLSASHRQKIKNGLRRAKIRKQLEGL